MRKSSKHDGLVRVIRTDKNGAEKAKYMRPKGKKPPSQAAAHRRAYVAAVRIGIINILGGKCVMCGYNADVRALQIDHINGDGKIDRVYTGGSYYHNIVKNLSSGRYQVLCANCNKIKASENQEYPRKENE